MINVECYRVGKWLSKADSPMEKAMADAKKAVRYSWLAVDGTCYTVFDNVEKKLIEIHGDRRWAKWYTANRANVVTDF